MSNLSLTRIIPSILTVFAFIFGFKAILAAISGQISTAIVFIIIAAIFDLLDGRVARALDVPSKFGEELDSLSDLVCFGIATSLIVLFSREESSKLLSLAITFFSVSTLLRLARFNVAADSTHDLPEETKNYYENFFVGVPTPAAFILAILPISIEKSFHIIFSANVYAIYLIFVSFLVVSIIPTVSTKGIKIPKMFMPLYLAVLGFLILLFIIYKWYFLSAVGTLYLLSIPISILLFFKKKATINSTSATINNN